MRRIRLRPPTSPGHSLLTPRPLGHHNRSAHPRPLHRYLSTTSTTPPLISLQSSTFYAHHPSTPLPASQNPPLFPNTTFALHHHAPWCILAPSPSKSLFLSILQGTHIPFPPAGRTYPYFTETNTTPFSAEGIALVQFGGGGQKGVGMLGGGVDGGGYISARYESFRSAEDVNLRRWLVVGGELNVDLDGISDKEKGIQEKLLDAVVSKLNLKNLLDQPVMTLSNGQVRRAKLARALLKRPQVLLVDEPFMGLDPPSTVGLSGLLKELATAPSQENISGDAVSISTTPLLALRTQDAVPSWIENIAVLSGDYRVLSLGKKEDVVEEVKEKFGVRINTTEEPGMYKDGILKKVWSGITTSPSSTSSASNENIDITQKQQHWDSQNNQEILIDLSSINVAYNQSSSSPTSSPRTLLKSFSWRLRRSDKWALLGPNGSGKTTLLSLLTSDHPQTYSQNITFFNHPSPRNQPPLQPLAEIQKRIGVVSPEVYAFFPKHLTVEKAVWSAWAENPVMKPYFGYGKDSEKRKQEAEEKIQEVLSYFSSVLPKATEISHLPFSSLSHSQQRLILFIRAIVKQPDLLILDEAFSGMDEAAKKLALEWVEKKLSPRQALVVVSHVQEEIPAGVERWIRLGGVEGGGIAEFGVL